MIKKVLVIAILAMAMFLGTAASNDLKAATINVDSFTDTTLATLSITSGNTGGVDSPVISAIGGVRDLSLTHNSGAGSVSLRVDAVNELLAFASDPNTAGSFSILWDGDAVGSTPSLNTDFTDGGLNEGLLLSVYADQVGWSMQIDARDQANTTTATYNFTETDDIRATGRVYYIPFSSFTNATVLTGGNVGFVQISVTGVIDLDLTIDFFDSVDLNSNILDMGDLPAGYGLTTLANNGAGHLNPGTTIRLGTLVDAEADGQADANAGKTGNGDDSLIGSDDEDGVTFTGLWNDTTGHVDVLITGTVNGCLTAYLDWHNGSFSFNPDGDFNDSLERIIDNQPVSPGNNSFSFTVLGFNAGATMYARFRVVPDRDNDGFCGSGEQAVLLPTGLVDDGEVEDYEISFIPTAVSLQNVAATGSSSLSVIILVAVALVGTGVLLARRRRTW